MPYEVEWATIDCPVLLTWQPIRKGPGRAVKRDPSMSYEVERARIDCPVLLTWQQIVFQNETGVTIRINHLFPIEGELSVPTARIQSDGPTASNLTVLRGPEAIGRLPNTDGRLPVRGHSLKSRYPS
jgi:hypothetical protein